MNELKVFSNEQFGQVRTVVDNGKVWFCGKDVAEALGYSNPRDALWRHCKPRGVGKHDTLTNSGLQAMTYIDEGNLYRLITHSKLPSAERFESWVFDEVLPEIRITGGYESRPKANNEQLIQIAKIIAKCPDKRLPYVIEILNPMLPSDFEVGKYKTGTKAKPYLPVNHGVYVTFQINVNAQPFSYALKPTVYDFAINGHKQITVRNSGISVIPIITVSAETTIQLENGQTLRLSEGTYETSKLKIPQGVTRFVFEGDGNVNLAYREAVI